MTRIFSDYAYGPGPRTNCYWDESATAVDWPEMDGRIDADLCIIGAGFTGVNAAIAAAQSGLSVVILEAETPGWGASGRNGGFCCLGGSKLDPETMQRRYGEDATKAYLTAEKSAVEHVAALLARHDIDADVHSDGETMLAHTPKHARLLRAHAEEYERNFGGTAEITPASELEALGMNGPFHGAVTIRTGFALNPRKYLDGILAVAGELGVRIFARSAAQRITRAHGRFEIGTRTGAVLAEKVLIATNGYSSETMPPWMAARYMPTQSTIVVTRELSGEEIQAQGWTSHQACYDTKNLLHYFRLMPNNRFLIGMRGGLTSSPRSEARARQKVRHHLARMFPAWSDVEVTHQWSGMVCLSPKLLPFAGEIPGQPGLFASFAYHGNGVAMGSYAGTLIGNVIAGQDAKLIPLSMRADPGRFPFGRARRIVMPPAYAAFWLRDL
jgi:glycine/D-amino acid oxidase-like deaminating enzyme